MAQPNAFVDPSTRAWFKGSNLQCSLNGTFRIPNQIALSSTNGLMAIWL